MAVSLYDAFEESKRLAQARLRNQTLFVFTNQYLEEVKSVFGADPFAYGVKRNLPAIDFVQTISVEQSLTPAKQPLDEVFSPRFCSPRSASDTPLTPSKGLHHRWKTRNMRASEGAS